MRFVADLHIHSYLSRATSKDLNLPTLHRVAQWKGISLLGTGDFTHPRWFAELRENLVPAEPGLFALRPDLARAIDQTVPGACRRPVRFMLQVEISNIYKRGDKVRKVHNLVFVPDLESAARLAARLAAIGNIESDGRPILGVDSRDLLELVLESSPDAFLIPAHVWTPWFSALGAQSGFDAIADCYRDLADHIFAVETGLSSDPAMNWRLSALDRYALVSSSDAHSPEKLGREANLFDCELSYFGVREALRGPRTGFLGTVEFFPEEGKYHLDGHRKCGVVLEPRAARAREGLCPVCDKRLTGGVLARVEALADRPAGFRPPGAAGFHNLIPLREVLGEVIGVGPASDRVKRAWTRLVGKVGSELDVLMHAPLEEVRREAPPLLDEALRRMRAGAVKTQPGYDGEYGIIRVFDEAERRALLAQRSFTFALTRPPDRETASGPRESEVEVDGARLEQTESASGSLETEAGVEVARVEGGDGAGGALETEPSVEAARVEGGDGPGGAVGTEVGGGLYLNPEQRKVVEHAGGPLLVVAGPGTGKTRVIVERIAHLVAGGVSPRTITAISFTRKAAAELGERLCARLGAAGRAVTASTFHALGLELLRAFPEAAGLPRRFRVLDEVERLQLGQQLCDGGLAGGRATQTDPAAALPGRGVQAALEVVSRAKARVHGLEEVEPELVGYARAYQQALGEAGAVDFDDLVARAVHLLAGHAPALGFAQERCRYLFVDEYQDVNPVQDRLVHLLAGGATVDGPQLCVVGDPDQAIYGFRGADPTCFAGFTRDYPGAVTVVLGDNYRSPPGVVAAASAVMAPVAGRAPRALVCRIEGAATIERAALPTAADEAEFIAAEIERALGGTSLSSFDSGRADGAVESGLAFHDIAVLFRTSAQADAIGEALERVSVPTRRVGIDPVLARPAVARLVASLRKSADRSTGDDGTGLTVSGRVRALAEREIADVATTRAADLLAALAAPHGKDAPAFLASLAVLRETDLHLEPQRVHLLTLHAAKGLEFPLVFIAGCEDGTVPLTLPGREVDLEEERRLLYVGMTRARKRLVLTAARRRTLYGRTIETRPCPFLTHLPRELLREIASAGRRRRARQLTFGL
jgi:DNA helicase II / ATP-dependent DNA helicase PcrA